jgi:hypothetical protein
LDLQALGRPALLLVA